MNGKFSPWATILIVLLATGLTSNTGCDCAGCTCKVVPPTPPPVTIVDPEDKCPDYNVSEDQWLSTFNDAVAIAAPAKVGTTNAKFEVTNGGDARYIIPLVVPPGVNGMTPQLSVVYDSSIGRGFFGLGGTLAGLTAVMRCPSRLIPDGIMRGVQLTAEDNLCLDGRKLVPVGNSIDANGNLIVEARTFPDTFVRAYIHYENSPADSPSKIVIEHASGRRDIYGESPDSRVMSSDKVVREWWLSTSIDRWTNAIEYTYTNTQDSVSGHTIQLYPQKIKYGSQLGKSAPNMIMFGYDAGFKFGNPHGRQFYKGMTAQRDQLIISIGMFAGGLVTRAYYFEYGSPFREMGVIDREFPVLSSVKECGQNLTGECKPPTYLSIEASRTRMQRVSVAEVEHPRTTDPYGLDTWNWILADVTGDGLPDVLVNETDPLTLTSQWSVYRNLSQDSSDMGTRFGTREVWANLEYHWDPSVQPAARWIATPLDYDDDGRADILLQVGNGIPYQGLRNYFVLRSTTTTGSNGKFTLIDTGIRQPQLHAERSFENDSSLLGDINGDGKEDLIECQNRHRTSEYAESIESNPLPVSWTVRLWTPNMGSQLESGFSSSRLKIDGMDATPCDAATGLIHIADFNADGQNDIIHLTPYKDNRYGLAVSSLQVPSNTWLSRTVRYPILGHDPNLGVGERRWPRFVLPDLNADGLPDVLLLTGAITSADVQQGAANISPPNVQRYFNRGDFSLEVSPFSNPNSSEWDYGNEVRVLDYNHDGRDDLLLPVAGGCPDQVSLCYAILRTNRDNQSPTLVRPDVAIGYVFDRENWYDRKDPRSRPLVADVHGDGVIDILNYDSSGLRIFSNRARRPLLANVSEGSNPLRPHAHPTDILKDGAPWDPPDPGWQPNIRINYGTLINRLRPSPSGTTQEIVEAAYYDQSYTYLPGSGCQYPVACVVSSRPVVSTFSINRNSMNEPFNYTVTYRDGRHHRLGQGWLGFGSRITYDENSGGGTWDVYDNSTLHPGFGFYPYIGSPIGSRTWALSDKDLSTSPRVDMSFVDIERSIVVTNKGGSYFVYDKSMSRRRKVESSPTWVGENLLLFLDSHSSSSLGVVSTSRRSIDGIDEYGSVRSLTEERFGTDDSDRIERTLAIEYGHDTNKWLIGRATKKHDCETAGGLTHCKEVIRKFGSQGQVVYEITGEPLINSSGYDPETILARAYFYDKFGNVSRIEAEDAYGQKRTGCITYEPFGIFPWKTVNPMGHVTLRRYHYGLGVLQIERDPNGLMSLWRYDGLGRLAWISDPGGASAQLTWRRKRDSQQEWFKTTLLWSSSGFGEGRLDFDPSGNIVREVVRGSDVPGCDSQEVCTAGAMRIRDIARDAQGRLTSHSGPYIDGDFVGANSTTTEYRYDLQDRLTEVREPWGSITSFAYEVNTVKGETSASETNASITNSTQIIYDHLGRIKTTRDAGGGETNYIYGPFSSVREISSPAGVTSLYSDAFGRVRHELDPDRGTSLMTYNGFGEVTTLRDDLGRSYYYEYDKLGRPIRRTIVHPASATNEISFWSYDSGPGGIGHAVGSVGPSGIEKSYLYDSKGRLSVERLSVPGEPALEVGFSYNSSGLLASIEYPSPLGTAPFEVYYSYDSIGRLLEIYDSSEEVLWRLESVDSVGRPRTERFRNGVTTARKYELDTGRLSSVRSAGSFGDVQSLAFEWDLRGNLKSRIDFMQSTSAHGWRRENFVYDELDRLTCSWLVEAGSPERWTPMPMSGCRFSVDYLPNGNIAQLSSENGEYKYLDSAHPHAVSEIGSKKFRYDAVGNQVSRPDWSIEWTGLNLPRQYVREDGESVLFSYDADGQRVLSQISPSAAPPVWVPESIDISLAPFYDGTSSVFSETHRFQIYNDERLIYVLTRRTEETLLNDEAQEVEGGVFLHVDHLGSPSAISDEQGRLVQRFSYEPFGSERNAEWGQQFGSLQGSFPLSSFTGHELDRPIGLINAGGRIYDAEIGRFLSVDPLTPIHATSQAFNPYSYVRNNPLTRIDPSGFLEETELIKKGFYYADPEGGMYTFEDCEVSSACPTGHYYLGVGISSFVPGTSARVPPPPPLGASSDEGVSAYDPMSARVADKMLLPMDQKAWAGLLPADQLKAPKNQDEEGADARNARGSPIWDCNADGCVRIKYVDLKISTDDLHIWATGGGMTLLHAGLSALDGILSSSDNVSREDSSDHGSRKLAGSVGLPGRGKVSAGRLFTSLKLKGWLWKRQGGDCAYCGVPMTHKPGKPNSAQVDHLIPFVQTRTSDPAHAVLSCRTCNLEKGGMSFDEWLEILKSEIRWNAK